jgi:hypothetical protein
VARGKRSNLSYTKKLLEKLHGMKKTIVLVVLIPSLASNTFAGTFSDGLTNGLNPAYWSIVPTTPGIYSVDPAGDGIALAKIAPTSGFQDVEIHLNLAALGGDALGNFSTQIDFTDAVIGPNDDQVQFNIGFSAGAGFDDVYDVSSGLNVHVWNGSFLLGPTPVTATSGTFSFGRVGSTITGYFNGAPIASEPDTGALSDIWFSLQNQPGAAGDSSSVTFLNFSLTDSVVPVQLLSPQISGTNFTFNFLTVSNKSYTIEQNTNLATTNWVPVATLTGTGSNALIITPLTNIPALFFPVLGP